MAIMGPSGSGKTTLMNIISAALDSPTSGEYLLEGKDIAQSSDSRLSDVRLHSIGFVFQSFYLLSRQSALENVALPLLYAGVRRKERQAIAQKALERVGLGERVNFKTYQLSGGQCQRVAIARAIVNNPKVLLADEPTGALDTKSGEQIMEIFQKLNEEGVTIVMITHEPEIAAHAQRVLHIRDGRLLEAASSDTPQAQGSAPVAESLPTSQEEAPSQQEAPVEKLPVDQSREESPAKGQPILVECSIPLREGVKTPRPAQPAAQAASPGGPRAAGPPSRAALRHPSPQTWGRCSHGLSGSALRQNSRSSPAQS